MNLLLDTHILLWWLDDNKALARPMREAIANAENVVFVSAVNVWEIVIKRALGKLEVPKTFRDTLAREPFAHLPVTVDHAFRVGQLPAHHRDPFDRLLIAQAMEEGLTLVTDARDIRRYEVRVFGRRGPK
ncbi:MAG: type II toxin-antitoxin system VapC family toxin [Kiritimatiellae bacterium]|nr:type II toxin-antitoxin system VapC family toxin [Kiritimatiellia bacterium]